MIPSNRSMLLCVRRAVAGLLPGIESKEQQAVLGSIDLHLNELLLRTDPSFYLGYYLRGRALIEEGIALGLAEESVLHGFPALSEGSGEEGAEVLGDLAERVMAVLEEVSTTAGVPRGGRLLDYLNRISDWEIGLYRHRLESAGGQDNQEIDSPLTKDGLQDYLRHRFPDAGEVEVTGLERVYGGFSKATSLFSTDRPIKGCQEFALRAEQEANIVVVHAGKVDIEFPVVSIAFEQGALVPEPLWLELDKDKLGARFIVFKRALGENFGEATGASAELSKPVLESLVRELVVIHRIELDPEDERVKNSHLSKWMAFESLHDNTLAYYEYWVKMFEDAPNSPSTLIRRGFDWLRANFPDVRDDTPCFLHGDYGLHNLLIHEDRVSAVLDWEMACVGDRAEDLSWFINCMTGAATGEELLSLYYEAGGKPISAERLHFYDVFRCVMMLIVCNVALAKLDRMGSNITLAVIGIQMCETFASKLRALIGDPV